MKVIIERKKPQDVETLGELRVFDGANCVWNCKSLELPDKGNRQRISCIPCGKYRCIPRLTKRFGKHFEVLNVPGREKILVHVFNYAAFKTGAKPQTLGCIGVGMKHEDINKDGIIDLKSSRVALDKIVELCPKGFDLEILPADA